MKTFIDVDAETDMLFGTLSELGLWSGTPEALATELNQSQYDDDLYCEGYNDVDPAVARALWRDERALQNFGGGDFRGLIKEY